MFQCPRHVHRQGFTLTEIAIVLGIIGLILGAIWTAAASVYANQHVAKAATETLMIVQNFKSLYGNNPLTEPNGENLTTFAMSAGLFPADMVQAGNATYAIGPIIAPCHPTERTLRIPHPMLQGPVPTPAAKSMCR